ncbi:hypothetical protein [Nocardia sp. N2S4-5]|uniref:hypothetical protein n=1 Tax=Nocardia sp. N2S4-5 TaxID=3351565 RepID=UPI0037D57355
MTDLLHRARTGRGAAVNLTGEPGIQAVFGLAAGPAPERFAVGLATLSLLSNLASEQ